MRSWTRYLPRPRTRRHLWHHGARPQNWWHIHLALARRRFGRLGSRPRDTRSNHVSVLFDGRLPAARQRGAGECLSTAEFRATELLSPKKIVTRPLWWARLRRGWVLVVVVVVVVVDSPHPLHQWRVSRARSLMMVLLVLRALRVTVLATNFLMRWPSIPRFTPSRQQ